MWNCFGRIESWKSPSRRVRQSRFLLRSLTKKFAANPGEHFVIGDTTFTLTDDQAPVSIDVRHPVNERTFSADFLAVQSLSSAEKQIEALSRLPDLVGSAASEQEMFIQLVSVLIAGIPRASAAAIVKCTDSSIEILHWDRSPSAAEFFSA